VNIEMAGDFRSDREPTSVNPGSPSRPPSVREPSDKISLTAFETEARLREHAARQASQWKLSPKRKPCLAINRKWRRAKASIEPVIRKIQEDVAGESEPSGLAAWLFENQRLLRAALRGTQRLPAFCRKLPQMELEDVQRVPRAYAAAAAYLEAVGGAFEDQAFDLYIQAAQEQDAFEIGELWAMRPLLQLVLLEKIASLLNPPTPDPAEPGAAPGRAAADAGGEAAISKFITSLREISDAEWKDRVASCSLTERLLRQDPAGAYGRMDDESRTVYLGVVEDLAMHSRSSEIEIAQAALNCAQAAFKKWGTKTRQALRLSHVGYYLVGNGRPMLERETGYRAPLAKQLQRILRREPGPEIFYLVGIEVLTFAIIALVLSGLRADVSVWSTLLFLLIPASESAIGVMNQLVSFLLPPRPLPKLDFSQGIPGDYATMVAVPTLLLNEPQVRQLVRDLEIRYLGNRDANLHFALLTDSPDSPKASNCQDELAVLASSLVEKLNEKYRNQPGGQFFHFHRHRIFNPSEGAWMGWERKRGKLLDFNNLLRGGFDSFPVKVGDLSILPKIRYVITLDSDTRLPRESAHRLIGTMAHPLNQAVIDPATNTVVEGYGILQPQVGISVRSANRSRLANIYSGQTGFDIYTRAVSNVYQDLTGEGSFTGKGIYEVDVFQRVLSRRFPDNSILSHDLIEGAYARAGLVSDVEVIDDYPSHFSAYSRRKHRWVRGDWQIMRWLLPRVPDYSGRKVPNPISLMSRWKILDNLRRSLMESATFALLLSGWFFLPGGATRWTVAVLVLLLIPSYFRLLLSLTETLVAENPFGHLAAAVEGFVGDQLNVFMLLAFLAHQTLVALDAIGRTFVRLTITHRNLLEWETAAESESETHKRTAVDFYLQWTPLLSVVIGAGLAAFRPKVLLVAFPILLLWALSGALSQWLNRPLRLNNAKITREEENFLRHIGMLTWRFFRTFCQAENNWLIPDNFQEEPRAVINRISPTNLGFLLNARLAAWRLGHLTVAEFVNLTEKTLAAALRLPRSKGHFLNWYDIKTLQPVDPLFISTADSGNLACCLWTLKQGCLEITERPIFGPQARQGMDDLLRPIIEFQSGAAAGPQFVSARDTLQAWLAKQQADASDWARDLPLLEQILVGLRESLAESTAGGLRDLQGWVDEAISRSVAESKQVMALAPWLLPDYRPLRDLPELGLSPGSSRLTLNALPGFLRGLTSKLKMLCETSPATNQERLAAAQSLRALIPRSIREAESLNMKLHELAAQADAMVRDMDFAFLFNSRRKLLSIGYDISRQHLEKGCYDLLASEARIATFIAIAKGDLPLESWFHLGRVHTKCGGRRVLYSWSGTLFEYLMPSLWMRTYPQTLLDQTLRAVVACQKRVARRKRTPWGISESACSRRDADGRYQYYAFGLKELALRPKTFKRWVVSPYAACLALAVDARAAVRNLYRMEGMGWLGTFGFYEAADFTSSAADKPQGYELVRCLMAHHQGMILLAVCNLLNDSAMQNLFHREPMVAATSRILEERVPRTASIELAES
jgi:cyclic beta-1,2-glucan synthetase